MKNQSIQFLIRTLCQKVGNKRYMRDLEKLLEEKMKDLTPHEQETLNMLARDIKFSK